MIWRTFTKRGLWATPRKTFDIVNPGFDWKRTMQVFRIQAKRTTNKYWYNLQSLFDNKPESKCEVPLMVKFQILTNIFF